jgi:BirA family biotin operon repressor/biotin-[acetyl-CoA-carboxylase] ligase
LPADFVNSTLQLPAGYRLAAFESLDSTNEQARRLAVEGALDGTVIWASSQTAGRGRQGRQWDSPEGNLYCSIVIRPEVPAADAAQLSFVTALALGQAVSGLLPDSVEMRYKWPNDVLLDGRKAAGILLESSGGVDGALDWLVIGAGLNVEGYPDVTEGGYPATSLREAGVKPVALQDILARYIAGFAHWRERWQNEGIAAVREAWLERAARLGEDITVRLPGSQLNGRFSGLDEGGALLLDLTDGSRRTITAGDVFF